MTEDQIVEIADKADIIVNYYAFTKQDEIIRIQNLRNPEHVMVIFKDGPLFEINMDEIEQVIVQNIWKKDAEFME